MYIELNRKKPKKKGMEVKKQSIRVLNKSWKTKSVHISTTRKIHINSLLDIGKNMHTLADVEKVFYDDHLTERKGLTYTLRNHTYIQNIVQELCE